MQPGKERQQSIAKALPRQLVSAQKQHKGQHLCTADLNKVVLLLVALLCLRPNKSPQQLLVNS